MPEINRSHVKMQCITDELHGGNSIRKKGIVVVSAFIVILFSSCAMHEKLEEMNNSESLIVLQWQFGIPDFKVRNDVFDEELIKEVNEVFAQVDWEEDAKEDRPLPEYQIGNYEIWIKDEDPIVEAVDLVEEKRAELTEEDSEFIIRFVISIFH